MTEIPLTLLKEKQTNGKDYMQKGLHERTTMQLKGRSWKVARKWKDYMQFPVLLVERSTKRFELTIQKKDGDCIFNHNALPP